MTDRRIVDRDELIGILRHKVELLEEMLSMNRGVTRRLASQLYRERELPEHPECIVTDADLTELYRMLGEEPT